MVFETGRTRHRAAMEGSTERMDERKGSMSAADDEEKMTPEQEGPNQEEATSTAGKVVSGFLWRFTERISEQVVQLLVSIVLARLLAPKDFGTISLVLVFTQVLQVFVDSGVATALIQKKDADDLDFSSVFYFNIVWC